MSARSALISGTFSTLGLLVCLACEDRERSAASAGLSDGSGAAAAAQVSALDEGSEGSALPCAVPLAWRVARVDGEFGVTMASAQDALRRAIGEWEREIGRTLFAIDEAAGSPIRLVYGDRQARSEERRRYADQMRGIGEDLERRREQLQRRTELASTSVLHYEQRSRDLQARVAAHNELVRRWNERGGAPQDVLRRVRAAGSALDRETQEMRLEAQGLEDVRSQIETERARFDEDVAEHNRLVAEIDARFPPTRVESGVYREAIRSERGRAVSASREIRVYRFSDEADLVRVLAHELGHSLGLGHVEEAGALMSEEYGPGSAAARRLIHNEDVNALIARCPGLFEG
jgi:hypothetical protein